MKIKTKCDNMITVVKVNQNYEVIERRVTNEKPIPNELLDLIIPILKK